MNKCLGGFADHLRQAGSSGKCSHQHQHGRWQAETMMLPKTGQATALISISRPGESITTVSVMLLTLC